MKLGVISDTHGNTAILREVVAHAGDVGHWLHAGDNYKDAVFLSKLSEAPVTAVVGNCDYHYPGFPQDECLELGGALIWLTHGHRHNVKHTVDDLLRQGKSHNADIIVFGHTHVPFNECRDGILVFNPGSLSYPRTLNHLTFGIITILGKNDITADIVMID